MTKNELLANLIIQYFEVESAVAWDFVTEYMIKEYELKEGKDDVKE